MIENNANANNKKWFFVFPFLAIVLHYFLSNLLYFATDKLFLDVFPLSKNRLIEFSYLAETLIYMILIVLFFAIYKVTTGKNKFEAKTHTNLKDSVSSIVAGLGTAGVIFLLITILGKIPALQKNVEALTSHSSDSRLLGTIVVSAICAPIIEELLFRGIVFKSLKKVTPVWVAILVSSFLFGAYHMNLVQTIYASFMGMIAAIIYEKKNNLIFPILVHITNNFLAAIQGFLPEGASHAIDVIAVISIIGLVYVLYSLLKSKANSSFIAQTAE